MRIWCRGFRLTCDAPHEICSVCASPGNTAITSCRMLVFRWPLRLSATRIEPRPTYLPDRPESSQNTAPIPKEPVKLQ